MPYTSTSEPSLTVPSDTASLWRYETLEHFASMLETDALAFTWLAHLQDQFEGRYSEGMRRHSLEEAARLGSVAIELGNIRFAEMYCRSGLLKVSCWCECEHELASMWRLPAKRVAIRTTWGQLRTAMESHEEAVYAGRVDYEFHEVPPPNEQGLLLKLAYGKPRGYVDEREFRLATWGTVGAPIERVHVDPIALVSGVHLAPQFAEPDVAKLRGDVEALLEKRGLAVPVIGSALDYVARPTDSEVRALLRAAASR